jgi:hypothetical protein
MAMKKQSTIDKVNWVLHRAVEQAKSEKLNPRSTTFVEASNLANPPRSAVS